MGKVSYILIWLVQELLDLAGELSGYSPSSPSWDGRMAWFCHRECMNYFFRYVNHFIALFSDLCSNEEVKTNGSVSLKDSKLLVPHKDVRIIILYIYIFCSI